MDLQYKQSIIAQQYLALSYISHLIVDAVEITIALGVLQVMITRLRFGTTRCVDAYLHLLDTLTTSGQFISTMSILGLLVQVMIRQ